MTKHSSEADRIDAQASVKSAIDKSGASKPDEKSKFTKQIPNYTLNFNRLP